MLTEAEARALARLATAQCGVESWAEHGDSSSWVVALRDGARIDLIVDGGHYVQWRDRRFPEISGLRDDARNRVTPWLVIRWAVGGAASLIAQAISLWFYDRGHAEWLYKSGISDQEQKATGWGYRHTHPMPPERRP